MRNAFLVMALACAAAACSPERKDAAGAGAGVGSIDVSLVLAPGQAVNAVSYTITGAGAFSRTGSADVSNSAGLTTTIGTIPAGAGYTIAMSATTVAGGTTCSGSAPFSVTAGATTNVIVHLACREPARSGSVAVTGVLNVCPAIDSVSATPAQVLVGRTAALLAVAHDSDVGPAALAYHWSASSGTFSNADVANPTFTCRAPGTATVTATVSDGDPAPGCADIASVRVACIVPGAGAPLVASMVAVYGDAPYGTTPTDDSQTLLTPGFIANVNADPDVSMVVHVGDIHSGKQLCTEAYDRTIADMWTAYADPLVYTPGDNEWTDCNKAAQGGGTYNAATGMIDFVKDSMGNLASYMGGDPMANLGLIRRMFFATPGMSLGTNAMPVLSQAQMFDPAHPADGTFVENVMFEKSGVLFVTIDLPGGSNNDNDVWYAAPTPSAAQIQEITDRTGADLRWLDAAFALAQADDAIAVVIVAQADMWDPEKGAAHQAAFEPYVASIASHTTAFGKPVLMFNGDSHVYQSSNVLSPSDPLAAMHPGYDVPNFHRVVVHGSTLPLEWLKLTIDPGVDAPEGPNAIGPFTWTRTTLQ